MEGLKESIKQFFGSLVRYFMVWLFGVMVSNQVIPEGFSNIVLESAIGLVTVSLLPLGALVWGWMAKRFNVLMSRYSRRAEPGTPMQKIKREVLEDNKYKVLPL